MARAKGIGDGTWVTLTEACRRTGYCRRTMQRLMDHQSLTTRRLPGSKRTEILAESLDQLATAIVRPAKLESLAQHGENLTPLSAAS